MACDDWERLTTPLLTAALRARQGGRIFSASRHDDQILGTDFFWNRNGKTYRLAARVRKAGFLRYKDDFTIREDRPRSGRKTELEKIRDGEWAQVYAYGFSDGACILHWSLFRMSRFHPDAPFTYMPGFGPGDQADTVTRIYRISGQPAGFLLDSSSEHAIPQRQKLERKIA